jgi:hypothetical protein
MQPQHPQQYSWAMRLMLLLRKTRSAVPSAAGAAVALAVPAMKSVQRHTTNMMTPLLQQVMLPAITMGSYTTAAAAAADSCCGGRGTSLQHQQKLAVLRLSVCLLKCSSGWLGVWLHCQPAGGLTQQQWMLTGPLSQLPLLGCSAESR